MCCAPARASTVETVCAPAPAASDCDPTTNHKTRSAPIGSRGTRVQSRQFRQFAPIAHTAQKSSSEQPHHKPIPFKSPQSYLSEISRDHSSPTLIQAERTHAPSYFENGHRARHCSSHSHKRGKVVLEVGACARKASTVCVMRFNEMPGRQRREGARQTRCVELQCCTCVSRDISL